MTESLGAKLANKLKKCKNNSFSDVTSSVKLVSTKSKRSQYFETSNLATKSSSKKKRANETQNVSEMFETSEDVKPNTRSTQRKKEASETIDQSSRKLANVRDKQQNIADSGLLCNNSTKPNKRRRNVNVIGGCHVNDDIDSKRKRLDQVLIDSDIVTSESATTEVVKNKKISRSRKANSATTKHAKIKSNKIKLSKTKSKSATVTDGDDDKDNDGDEDSEDDDDDIDWEEVNADDGDVRPPRKQLRDVEVVIQMASRGKKTPEEQMMDEFRCAVNRTKVLRQKHCHQVHLLCYIAIGQHYNKICNDPELQALALSHVPTKFLDQTTLTSKVESLFSFVTWFHKYFPCQLEKDSCGPDSPKQLTTNLKQRFEEKEAKNIVEHSLMVVIILRVLGFNVRLIHSFEPITSKPSDLLMKPSSSSAPLLFGNSRKFSSKTKSSKKDKAKGVTCDGNSSSKNKSGSAIKSEKVGINDNADLEHGDGKIFSTSGSDDDDGKFDWWTEVYLPKEKRWIYVNSYRCVADDFSDARSNIRRPFSYVLAWQNEGYIKDLTSRYDPDWLLVSYRKRVDPDWWKSTLAFYAGNQSDNDAEDLTIEDELLKQPLPSSVSAYKNHPLYVLSRHLLKFECIYPPTSLILGYVKDEAVYSRDCVHVLHSKEKWTVEGRVVREDEEPYKVVKRRPKTNGKNRVPCDENLRLFGRWQTELFVPKPAVGGVVPKNDFGNVEIFKPWMLPPGTVLIEEAMPGLNRVAKKLEIDVAPAMLGWEFHRNISAPILKGWVVCTEHKEILTAAWEEEQRNIREKELEKRQERVIKNWKKLARALLIRERLKEQFSIEYSQGGQKQRTKSRASKKRAENKKLVDRLVAVTIGNENADVMQTGEDLGGGFILSDEEMDDGDNYGK